MRLFPLVPALLLSLLTLPVGAEDAQRQSDPDGGTVDGGEEEKLPAKPLSLKDIDKHLVETQRKQGLLPPEDAPIQQRLIGGIPTDTLGDEMPEIQTFPVEDILADPSIFAGERVRISGIVRRGCTTGCWVELGEWKTAPTFIRVIPGRDDWRFTPSDRDRRVIAYGKLTKKKLDKKQAQALDVEAGQKPKSAARSEWTLEAEGAWVQWLN